MVEYRLLLQYRVMAYVTATLLIILVFAGVPLQVAFGQLLPPALNLEERLSRMAGWVLAAERSGAQYGLRLPGTEIAPAHGELHCAACLQALALYEAA